MEERIVRIGDWGHQHMTASNLANRARKAEKKVHFSLYCPNTGWINQAGLPTIRPPGCFFGLLQAKGGAVKPERNKKEPI